MLLPRRATGGSTSSDNSGANDIPVQVGGSISNDVNRNASGLTPSNITIIGIFIFVIVVVVYHNQRQGMDMPLSRGYYQHGADSNGGSEPGPGPGVAAPRPGPRPGPTPSPVTQPYRTHDTSDGPGKYYAESTNISLSLAPNCNG
jgi:hypothetical protein